MRTFWNLFPYSPHGFSFQLSFLFALFAICRAFLLVSQTIALMSIAILSMNYYSISSSTVTLMLENESYSREFSDVGLTILTGVALINGVLELLF